MDIIELAAIHTAKHTVVERLPKIDVNVWVATHDIIASQASRVHVNPEGLGRALEMRQQVMKAALQVAPESALYCAVFYFALVVSHVATDRLDRGPGFSYHAIAQCLAM